MSPTPQKAEEVERPLEIITVLSPSKFIIES
jgi:hypothetical protein